MRAALGASQGRLIQQTITEGALLAVAGGTIGVWVAGLGPVLLVNVDDVKDRKII